MSRSYPIPPDIHEKERIIGGIFTLSQFVFIVIAGILAIGTTLAIFSATSNFVVSIIIGVIVASPFLPFGFIKVRSMGDVELFVYLKYKLKYKTSNKEFKNINDNFKEVV